jgi:hypothetical protein
VGVCGLRPQQQVTPQPDHATSAAGATVRSDTEAGGTEVPPTR